MYKLFKPNETAKLIEAYYELIEKTKGTATVKLEQYGRDEYCDISFKPERACSTVNIGGIEVPTEVVKTISINEDKLKFILTSIFKEYGLDVSQVNVCIEPAKGYDSREYYPEQRPAYLKGVSIKYELIKEKDNIDIPKR